MANNACDICKFLGAESCGTDDECVFAQCFLPGKEKIFELLEKIFGAAGIYKILNDENLLPSQRQDAVRSLVYAAETRIRDPISGIVGMVLEQEHELEALKVQIQSAKNELETIVEPNKVPPYYNLPIPDIGYSTTSLMSLIEKVEKLNEAQKKQLMQLPPADAQKIMNQMIGKKEDHGGAGPSTSAGPSMP